MRHHVNEVVLDNGVRGLLIDIPDATVLSAELNFRAGDYLSPKGKWEVAHVLEHMVLGANEKFPRSRLFNAEFTKNGAYSNASTSAYDLNYIAECADFEWQRVLDLLLVAIDSPVLPEIEFNAESGNVREELTGDLNHHFRQLLIMARQELGLVSLSDGERLQQLNNIELDDIRRFYKKTHRSDNMRFVLAGNVNERREHIEKAFSGIRLERGKRIPLPKEKPKRLDEAHYIERPGLENLYFLWHTFRMHELEDKEIIALKLVNVMLTETLHSRILGSAREQGLAYDLMSQFTMYSGLTDWWFGAEIRAENVETVFKIMRQELKRIMNGTIDDSDVKAAQQYMIGRHQRSVQTARSLMKMYAKEYFYNGNIRDFNNFEKDILSITGDDMIDVVKRMFEEDIWGLSVLGTGREKLARKLHERLAVLWS